MKDKLRNKWIWIIGGVVLVALVAFVVMGRGRALAAEQEAETGDVVMAFIGDLSSSATASGQVVAQRDAQLSLTTNGTVAEILVEVGDEVKAQYPLLLLETAVLCNGQRLVEQKTPVTCGYIAWLIA